MANHIDNKDKGDNITKILADRLEESKNKLLDLTFTRMLVGASQSPAKWYKTQMANLNAFKIQVDKKAMEEKKAVLQATKQGTKELNLTTQQSKQIINEVNREMNNLNKMIISNYVQNVASIKVVAEIKKDNVSTNLYNTIRDKMLSTQDYGIVNYKNGRNVKWENYMEMKLRTDIQNDVAKNMVKDGYAAGNIFYITSFYGDCAPDHADYQGKIYVDEDWQSIAPKNRIEEIDQYIKANKIMTVQEVMDGPVYLTTRPNCRHYFQYISIDEVLGIKDNNDLNNKRKEYDLNANGKYKPEKYEALTKQRYNERQIRHWKGRAQTEQKLLDKLPKSASKQERLLLQSKVALSNRKVRTWQSTQRSLLKANKGVLQRNYDREAYRRMISDFRIKDEIKKLNNPSSGGTSEKEIYIANIPEVVKITFDYRGENYKNSIKKNIEDKNIANEVVRCSSLIFDNGKSTKFESVCIIDKKDLNSTYYNPNGKPNMVSIESKGFDLLTGKSEYIVIHNHRGNTPPSYGDLKAAYNRKSRFNIKAEYLVFTNNGSIYYYKDVDFISERVYNEYVKTNNLKQMENGLKKLAKEHGFIFEKWR